MSRFRKAWQSLNFYKEYLFGFETLIFATLQILYMHKQLVTLQEKGKHETASYDPFNKMTLIFCKMQYAGGLHSVCMDI